MPLVNIFFPFKHHQSFLSKKRWYRFSIVSFWVCIIAAFCFICYMVSSVVVEQPGFNVDIRYNLRDFTKATSSDIVNTVPAFVDGYRVGCKVEKRVKPLSDSVINKTVCNSDLANRLDVVSATFLKVNPSAITTDKKAIAAAMAKTISEDKETRYCFVNQGANCMSYNIVAYERNIFFYVEVFLISVIVTYIIAVILHVIYFNGLIYILYGGEK